MDGVKTGLPRLLLAETLRYVATTQAGPLVILHAGWILLALATWQDTSAGVTRPLVQAFVWLGGTDPQGHGDKASILAVWAKLSLGVYLLLALIRQLRGSRPPMALWKVAGASGIVALAGFSLAFRGDRWEDGWVIVVFAVLAAGAAAWAVLAARAAEALIRRMDEGEVGSPAA